MASDYMYNPSTNTYYPVAPSGYYDASQPMTQQQVASAGGGAVEVSSGYHTYATSDGQTASGIIAPQQTFEVQAKTPQTEETSYKLTEQVKTQYPAIFVSEGFKKKFMEATEQGEYPSQPVTLVSQRNVTEGGQTYIEQTTIDVPAKIEEQVLVKPDIQTTAPTEPIFWKYPEKKILGSAYLGRFAQNLGLVPIGYYEYPSGAKAPVIKTPIIASFFPQATISNPPFAEWKTEFYGKPITQRLEEVGASVGRQLAVATIIALGAENIISSKTGVKSPFRLPEETAKTKKSSKFITDEEGKWIKTQPPKEPAPKLPFGLKEPPKVKIGERRLTTGEQTTIERAMERLKKIETTKETIKPEYWVDEFKALERQPASEAEQKFSWQRRERLRQLQQQLREYVFKGTQEPYKPFEIDLKSPKIQNIMAEIRELKGEPSVPKTWQLESEPSLAQKFKFLETGGKPQPIKIKTDFGDIFVTKKLEQQVQKPKYFKNWNYLKEDLKKSMPKEDFKEIKGKRTSQLQIIKTEEIAEPKPRVRTQVQELIKEDLKTTGKMFGKTKPPELKQFVALDLKEFAPQSLTRAIQIGLSAQKGLFGTKGKQTQALTPKQTQGQKIDLKQQTKIIQGLKTLITPSLITGTAITTRLITRTPQITRITTDLIRREILFPKTDIGGGYARKEARGGGRGKKLDIYFPDFTSKVLGLGMKATAGQKQSLLKTEFSGLELRRGIWA